MGAPNSISLGLGITFPVLAIVAVCARFWARRQKRLRLWWDDYLILPGLIFAIGSAVCLICVSALSGLGTAPDAPGKPPSTALLPIFAKIRYADTATLPPALCFPKLSILMLYHRIFVGKWFKRATWVMLCVNIGWGLAFSLVYLFQCQPIAAAWLTTIDVDHRTCINLIPFNYAFAASTIVLDVLIIVLPWPVIWGLQMPFRQKVAVTGIFLLAGVVTGVSIGKLRAFVETGRGIKADHNNIIYVEGPLFYWTVPEGCLATVSACLPTMRPLFHGWSPESLIGSIRSKLSLQSMRGSRSSGDKPKSDNSNILLKRLRSENSYSSSNKILQGTEIHEHSEDLETGPRIRPMNEVDPTKQAPRWTIEESRVIAKSHGQIRDDL